ncbi:glutamate 5-kinase [Salipaludibacillus sp. CF4.18]|uniref:glutamate 5-kinase n=1 Tax=Salipaludibacillus sp. CF4.18 TaxID=3373081 RepID=UPI003EE53A7C
MAIKRIVIKIGSSSLTEKDGQLANDKVSDHADAIASIMLAGFEVVLISSGAVAAGVKQLGLSTRPVTTSGKQAAAAVGQHLLMQKYGESFKKHQINTAQLLLTRNDFYKEEQYQNAYNTLDELLKRRVLPIINENDSTAIEELTFGDNDMLSALVSGFLHADQLIILTDIDGIYQENPLKNPSAMKYNHLNGVSEELLAQAEDTSSKVGTGGMKSKLQAARTALSMGVNVFIGTRSSTDSIEEILAGNGNGTYLTPTAKKIMKTKKQWIAYHSSTNGKLIIDEGAAQAILKEGKSLLPVGITSIQGEFNIGDVVQVCASSGVLLGKGKVTYSSDQLRSIISIGNKQSINGKKEAIHRDQWIIV